MATKTVQTPGGPMLFSRVMAHDLERGDWVVPDYLTDGSPWLVLARPHRFERPDGTMDDANLWLYLDQANLKPTLVDRNKPVWRAVGGRAGGVA